MIRVLIVDDDESDAIQEVATWLKDEGIECSCTHVANPGALVQALQQPPDIVLVNLDAEGISGRDALSSIRSTSPTVALVMLADRADAELDRLAGPAATRLSTAELEHLGPTVRTVLMRAGIPIRRTSDVPQGVETAPQASGAAEHLLQRRAALDKVLPRKDTSAMASILRRIPPAAAALVMVQAAETRARYVKLLRNANIEVDEASEALDALARLNDRVHAVLFTDRLELIGQTRQLYAGSATHIVFVNHGPKRRAMEALRAGANDTLSSEARGEVFWAHLTTVRRIVSLASSLQLALTDNRILSTIDELTRCGSRRFFEHQFPREVVRANRLGRPLVLVMADIDHFKAINDTHGHQVGDEVLREFADRLTQDLRQREDWLARVGGEEFAVILPETEQAEALLIAERLCERIRANPFATTAGPITVTASFGVCSQSANLSGSRLVPEVFVRRADAALYESKRAGRNRVTLHSLRADEEELAPDRCSVDASPDSK